MENEVEEKSVLLENLYNLHRGIDYIYQKQNYKMKLENDRRKAKQIQAQLQNLLESNSSNKIEKMMRQSFYVVLFGALGNLAKFLLMFWFGDGNLLELVMYLAATAILIFYLQKKIRRKTEKWLNIWTGIILVMLLAAPLRIIFLAIIGLISFNLFDGIFFSIVTLGMLYLTSILGKIWYPKWVDFINTLIDDDNKQLIKNSGMRQSDYDRQIKREQEIKEEQQQCEIEMQEAAGALVAFGSGWYPKDYYFIEAIEFFIGALENFKADNMKELVNLYDETKYKELQLNYQKEMLQLQREQYIDTKKMLQALRYNNYVQTLQLQQLDGIRRNTEEAVDYLRNLRVQENHYHTHNHYHQNNFY